MSVMFVTAIVLPKDERLHRNIDIYKNHFTQLKDANVPICLFVDERLETELPTAAHIHTHRVCMNDKWIDTDKLPKHRNLQKDTASYMSIQLCKLWFVEQATQMYDIPYFAWIDFGVFHMFRNVAKCQEKLRSLSQRTTYPNTILAPGCWESGTYDIYDSICWRFCGSFFLGPRDVFAPAYERQQQLVRESLPTLTWEVNYWSRMEDHFTWYKGDHSDLLLNIPE